MKKENNNKKVYKLHSDGNYFTRAKKAGFGGYIEDENGTPLVEYTEQIKNIEFHFCYEILGLIRGLQIAQSMGVEHIIAYGDDKTLMQNVSSLSKEFADKNLDQLSFNSLPNNGRLEFYKQAIELANSFKSFECHYIPREENKYSDSLSRRYATLIEKNYINQFEDDLRRSEMNLAKGIRPKRRQFFSAPTMLTMQEKNNPFLVAPSRNRPLRSASRAEYQKNYQFVFMELGTDEHHKTLKFFYYKDKNNLESPIVLDTRVFPKDNFTLNDYLSCLEENLIKIDRKRPLWLHSNITQINAMFEQKEKIPRDDEVFNNFVKIYNSFLKIPRVWCHHFPFEHKYSNEIIQKKNREREAKQQEIQTKEELFEIFSNPKLSHKDRKTTFGKMFRYHIKENEEILGRDLTDDEKQDYRGRFEKELKEYVFKRIKEYEKEQSYRDEEIKNLSRSSSFLKG